MYFEGDIPVIQSGCNGNNNGFGSDWGDLAALIVVAGIFGGFGNGGGLFGGGTGGAYGVEAAVQRGFDTNGIMNKLEGINSGLCDGFYAMNTGMLNGFAGVQQTLCQGFGGVNTAIMQSGYETRNAINGVSAQLASCCCDLARGQERLACDIERSTNATIQANNANTQRLLDFWCNKEIAALQAENQALRFGASQTAQNQFITQVGNDIVNRLNPTPVPAYPVFAPSMSFAYPSGVTFGVNGYNNNSYNNSGCGCGCGCAA